MKNQWNPTPIRPGEDPYIQWSLGPSKRYFLSSAPDIPLFSVLLQLTDITAAQVAEECANSPPDVIFQIPSFYLSPPRFLRDLTYITAIVSEPFFEFLRERSDLRVVPLILGPPLPAGTFCPNPAPAVPQPPTGAPEAGTVVVGVIDDSFAFGHRRFGLAAGDTRVEYVWLQDGPCTGPGSPVPYGRELRKADLGAEKGIDRLLNESTTAGFLDEDKLYRLAGAIDFRRDGHKAVARRASHGTHVLDLAAGYDPGDNRRDRPIVCVQLPWRTTADTSGSRLDPFVEDGVMYILDRADQIAKKRGSGPLPVVINFSYGTIAGPHDGTSPLELAIDEIIDQRKSAATNPPLEVVLPAGNSHLARAHAQVSFPNPGDVVDLHWRVQPDDRTSSFLEIWLPFRPGGGGPTRMELTVTPPGGATSPLLDEVHGKGFEWRPHADPLCWMFYHLMPPALRGRFFVAMLPTEYLDPPTELAPPGVWTVTLHNVSLGAAEQVHAWIQRDDTPFGYPVRGRQSYFDEGCYMRFHHPSGHVVEEDADQPPCHIKRAGSINALATGGKVIVAGGYHRKELRLAPYSAGGPITPPPGGSLDPAYRKPDATLVSEDSKVHAGVIAAGSRSGSLVAINGTSVAAPQLTRWIADELAAGSPGDRDAVRVKASADEAALPAGKPPLSPERGGWGRMLRDSAFPRQRYWD